MRTIKFLIFALLLSLSSAYSASALSLEVGSSQNSEDLLENHLNFQSTFWYQWDQMVFFGLSGGTQQYGEDYYYPALTSALIRLPIGRTLLPYATAQWGYLFGPEHQFTWTLGGGLDLKLGRDSSLLITSGYQKFTQGNSRNGWQPQIYLRGGIILEF